MKNPLEGASTPETPTTLADLASTIRKTGQRTLESALNLIPDCTGVNIDLTPGNDVAGLQFTLTLNDSLVQVALATLPPTISLESSATNTTYDTNNVGAKPLIDRLVLLIEIVIKAQRAIEIQDLETGLGGLIYKTREVIAKCLNKTNEGKE